MYLCIQEKVFDENVSGNVIYVNIKLQRRHVLDVDKNNVDVMKMF